MRTRKEKPTYDVPPVKPMTINLQTRPFAPIDTEDSTPVKDQNKSSGKPFHGEDLFLKLINTPIQERTPSKNEVMRKFGRDRFAKAISQGEIEATQVQAKQNIGEPNDKYEQKADNTATKFRRPFNLSTEGIGLWTRLKLKKDRN